MSPQFLLDTHVLVRWLAESKKLTRDQARVIESATRRREPMAISAQTLVEIALLSSAGKLDLGSSLHAFFNTLQSLAAFVLIPLSYEVAEEAAAIGMHAWDPADRVIVATARVHGLRLLTSDERIVDARLVTCVD